MPNLTFFEVLKLALQTLENAPVKHRIDFDPYWWWYDKECVPTIAELREALSKIIVPQEGQDAKARLHVSVAPQRGDSGSTERSVDSQHTGVSGSSDEGKDPGTRQADDAGAVERRADSAAGSNPVEREVDPVTKALSR